MGYNKGMSIELCKFAGGKCDLCNGGTICKSELGLDYNLASRFIDRKVVPMRPTCHKFEHYWRRAFDLTRRLTPSNANTWNGMSARDGTVLKVYPAVEVDVSDWYIDGCPPISTVLLEKNPYSVFGNIKIGEKNGFVVINGIPFAVDTRGDRPLVTRPVIKRGCENLLRRYIKFQDTFGPIYNSQ